MFDNIGNGYGAIDGGFHTLILLTKVVSTTDIGMVVRKHLQQMGGLKDLC